MLLDRLRTAGFTVALTEHGTVRITPASGLDDAQRAFLREHRDTLAAELAAEAVQAHPVTADPVLTRGRRLLERLRWTGRRVGLGKDGALVVHPRLGTADPFGRDVAAHPDDVAAALAVEGSGS